MAELRSATMFMNNTEDASWGMVQTTIPASQIVNVIPQVLSPGGNQLAMVGLMVGSNTRVPIGTVQSFPNYASALAFFGTGVTDTLFANIYFSGYTNSNSFPGALLYAQIPYSAVSAYIRGGNISALTLAQLQSVNGTLNITIDGYARSGTVNLASATSFSAAAALIQTALNTSPATLASFNGSIGAQTATFNGYIAGNVLNVTSLTSGTIVDGGLMGTAGGVSGSTLITGQLTQAVAGISGGAGTYAVSQYQSVASSGGTISFTETWGLMNVTSIGTGTISLGQTVTGTVSGSTPLVNTIVTALVSATGTVGTYVVNLSQTFSSVTLSTTPTNVIVTYDSISGGIIITSGASGAESLSAFALSGTVANALLFTQSTGAILSQGADPVTPQTFMASVVSITANWATFFLAHDPDNGNGFQSRLNFALWATSGVQNQAFLYIAADTDPSPTLTVPATASFGYQLGPNGNNVTAVTLMYDPTNEGIPAFVSGAIASINFNLRNGRTDLTFRSQAGLVATVTTASAASNLVANGYNFYGAYATAAQTFVFLYNGQMFGPFKWIDSFVNQIFMNASFQSALMTLLTQTPSIPYNPGGYSLVAAALQTPIQAAGNFGVFRTGVALSASQAATVNSVAGINISGTLQQQGYYLLITDPGPIVRAARGSPNVSFFYTDGQDIQQIVMTSTDLL